MRLPLTLVRIRQLGLTRWLLHPRLYPTTPARLYPLLRLVPTLRMRPLGLRPLLRMPPLRELLLLAGGGQEPLKLRRLRPKLLPLTKLPLPPQRFVLPTIIFPPGPTPSKILVTP